MNHDLLNFLKEQLGENKNYSPDIMLYKDLNLYGEEAYDFLIRFSQKFSVDILNFNFSRHFPPEIDIISHTIFNLFKNKKYLDLTIADLEKAILKGKLE